MRDDAEAASVVAALRDLQIGVVARREPDALRRQQIEEGIVRARHRLVHLLNHRLILMRAGDGEHAWMRGADAVGLDAKAAGDDDLAVLGQGFADRRKQLLLGAIEKAASVDHHGVGALIARRQLVAFGAQLGDDALRIDQRLGAAQADKANPWTTSWCGPFFGRLFRGCFRHGRPYRQARDACLPPCIKAAGGRVRVG